MKIRFEVAGAEATFTRSNATGAIDLWFDGIRKPLADPMDLSSQLALKKTKTWTIPLRGATIRIEHTRPRLFAAFRPGHYRVFVDDQLVVERSGF